MEKHKKYFVDSYPRYWKDAVLNKYGVGEYETAVLQLINSILERMAPDRRILEVAMGTGFPFAVNLAKRGHQVYGMDLSFELVKIGASSSRLYPFVGDGEMLGTRGGVFDITYCIRSSWYFKNLNGLIREMFTATKVGGYVILDIMNGRNWFIWLTIGNAYTCALRLLLVNLKRVLTKKPLTLLSCPTTPSDPSKCYALVSHYFSEVKMMYWDFRYDLSDGFREMSDSNINYPRLIYVCKKK